MITITDVHSKVINLLGYNGHEKDFFIFVVSAYVQKDDWQRRHEIRAVQKLDGETVTKSQKRKLMDYAMKEIERKTNRTKKEPFETNPRVPSPTELTR